MDVPLKCIKDKDVDRLVNRLCQYPFQVANPTVCQALSRHKVIRYVNKDKKNPNIVIRKGAVGLKPNVRIVKNGDGFKIIIF